MQRLFISFSGGETSGYMTDMLLRKYRPYFDIVVGFANTGQENEETLKFVNRCDKELGFRTVWLEAVVNPGKVACTHKIVTFESASRLGQPFEAVIQKYGIPNQAYPHCTRELKLSPITSYLRSIGWESGTYLSAVGIRLDEPKRWGADAGLIYPLVYMFPTDKQDVNTFWEGMPFRLELEGYQGNCKWCWKKSDSKLIRIALETPQVFDFPARMEGLHGLAGHNVDGTKRVFFRQNRSAKQMLALAKEAYRMPLFENEDESSGCTESCDPMVSA